MEGKIWIEFDDGDSGFFQLNEIKRIHPDFPVEGTALPSESLVGISNCFYLFIVVFTDKPVNSSVD